LPIIGQRISLGIPWRARMGLVGVGDYSQK